MQEQNIEKILKAFDYYFGFIFVTDETGKPIYINKVAAECMGAGVDEILSLHCDELQEKGLISESVVMSAIKAKERKTKVINYPLTGKTIAVVCIPIFDDDGELSMTISFSQMEDAITALLQDVDNEKALFQETLSFMEDRFLGKVPIVADSVQAKKAFRMASLIARESSSVLLLGESGSGKEIMAHFIHQKSMQSKFAFIPVNCAAIPTELMESQFFGYAKGAFTGADVNGKPGLFDMADNGTLFLDELAELPLDLQPKLLRAIETGRITPVGSGKEHETNVRIIAATNRDLQKMVAAGQFREDLYYRLNVFPIHIPPLRDRPEDIVHLSEIFLESFNRKYAKHKRFAKETIDAFLEYSWPGNIRELRNLIERLVLVSYENKICLKDVDLLDIHMINPVIEKEAPQYSGNLKEQVKAFERDVINKTLTQFNGDINQTTKALGISRSSFYQKKF